MSVNLKLLQTPFRKDGPNGDALSSQSPRNKKPRLTTAPATTLDSINFPLMETRRSIGRQPSSDTLRHPATSNGQGHPFTDPLRKPLRTPEGLSLSHSIHYQFTGAAEPITRHVSAPDNDSPRRGTRRPASQALQSRRRHTQREGDGQIFPPLNSRATSQTQTWSRASDSRQGPDLSCSPPYTRHVSESTSNLSPEDSLPLHSGETSRTQMWSRASDSQPRQFSDVSLTPQATRHVSSSTPNISSAGSSSNLSQDTSHKLYLEALECIPLLP